ncbi:signal transduction histidine kinase [Streptacidiphilus sp. MAP12-20]|uniref:sensor histidine kinase n=1 Tax=Streptacidiphilus sp. MAP12-20 TaxID=3156299 RepID=UPI003519B9AB
MVSTVREVRRIGHLARRTGRGLGAPVHLIMLALLLLVGFHVIVLEGHPHKAPLVLSLLAAFGGVYLLAPQVCRRVGANAARWSTAREVVPEAVLWLVALTALWLSLTVLVLEFELILAPLYFVYLLVLPVRPGHVIGGLTGAALLLRMLVHGTQGSLPFLGLLVGAGLALGLARCLVLIGGLRCRDKALVEELRRVSESTMEEEREVGRVEERGRLAQDVHDTVAQGLSAMAMLLQAADESLTSVAHLDKARTRLRAAAEINSVALGQARDIVHGIAFSELGDGGLPPAVRRYVALVQRTLIAREQVRGGEQRLVFTLKGAPFRLPLATESALLRVIQEAVNNALRHGWATRVEVILSYLADRLTVEVRDNGVGLPPGVVAGAERAPAPEGLGLGAMRDRVERVGGELALSSWVGRGTIVSVDLPLAGLARLSA